MTGMRTFIYGRSQLIISHPIVPRTRKHSSVGPLTRLSSRIVLSFKHTRWRHRDAYLQGALTAPDLMDVRSMIPVSSCIGQGCYHHWDRVPWLREWLCYQEGRRCSYIWSCSRHRRRHIVIGRDSMRQADKTRRPAWADANQGESVDRKCPSRECQKRQEPSVGACWHQEMVWTKVWQH
jgi:hypothetical protein